MTPKRSSKMNSVIDASAVRRLFASRAFLPILFLGLAVCTARAQPASSIPTASLIQPDALHHELQANPHAYVILQVGSRMLFDQAHISGAEYTGPASSPAGLAALRARVDALPRGQLILLYCGCCPWSHCPNIAPAWALLHGMGFARLRVLYIAQNFGADWVARGYGADRSQ